MAAAPPVNAADQSKWDWLADPVLGVRPDLIEAAKQRSNQAPGLDGFDTAVSTKAANASGGPSQIAAPGQVAPTVAQYGAKYGKAALDWITEQGVTTIIIQNYSSKVLSRVDGAEQLTHPKEANWGKKAKTQIDAAKDGKPGEATITVTTDMKFRGVTRANTSGWVLYEIVGEAKGKVKVAWLRKGDGELDTSGWGTESGNYEIRGYQSNKGEFTFEFREVTPAPKPKDAQTPPDKDKKPAQPESDATKPKDSKGRGEEFEYTIVPFKIGKSDKLESGTIAEHVYEIWNKKLSEETRHAIIHKLPGGVMFEVHGYASNTDTAERNLDLSKQRAEAVIAALKKVGVPATAIADPQPHGEWETKPSTDDKAQEKEDPDWRKVVVKVGP